MPVLAFIFLECTVGKAKEVAKKVAKISGVKISHAVTGGTLPQSPALVKA